MTEVVCMTWVVFVTWVVCTHLGLLTSVSRAHSVVSLLVEGSSPFCPSVILPHEEGVVLSCSVSLMGMSFFYFFGLFSMCGGLSMVVGLLLCFVLCVDCRTVFVILLVTSGQLMF